MNRPQITQAISADSEAGNHLRESAKSADLIFRCEVVAVSRSELIEQLIAIVREEGFVVLQAQKWEKKSEFLKRMRLQHVSFDRILRSPQCPHVDIERGNGGAGRVNALSSNPVFEAFCDVSRGRSPHPKVPRRVAEGRPSRAKPDAELKRNRKGKGRKLQPKNPRGSRGGGNISISASDHPSRHISMPTV